MIHENEFMIQVFDSLKYNHLLRQATTLSPDDHIKNSNSKNVLKCQNLFRKKFPHRRYGKLQR